MATGRITRWKYKALAVAKFCLSFRKSDWQLFDYPVAFRDLSHEAFLPDTSHWKSVPCSAFIVNWGLIGTGDTQAEALSALQEAFQKVKKERAQNAEPLPRPGSNVPTQMAPTARVEAHPELADDFITRVLELDWALITDESSLWDFNAGETNEPLFARIKLIYGVEVADIQSARLCEIFERIAAAKNQSP